MPTVLSPQPPAASTLDPLRLAAVGQRDDESVGETASSECLWLGLRWRGSLRRSYIKTTQYFVLEVIPQAPIRILRTVPEGFQS